MIDFGDELPNSKKYRGLDMARRQESSARSYVTEIVAGILPASPDFEAIHEIHDLVTAGQITWSTAAEQVRKIRSNKRKT